MPNKFNKLRKLLNSDKTADEGRYSDFLNNVRELQNLENQEKAKSIIRESDTTSVRSEPNVLQRIVKDPSAKAMIEDTKLLSTLRQDSYYPELDITDKTINNQIIKQYLKAKNPAVLKNIEEASKDTKPGKLTQELVESQRRLLQESAELLTGERNNFLNLNKTHVNPIEKNERGAIGEYSPDTNKIRLYSDSMDLPENLNTPGHEFIHLMRPRSSSQRIQGDLTESKDLVNSLVEDSGGHFHVPLSENIEGLDKQDRRKSPESAFYYNRLRKLIKD